MSIQISSQLAEMHHLTELSAFLESSSQCLDLQSYLVQARSYMCTIGDYPNLYLVLKEPNKTGLSWHAINDKIELIEQFKNNLKGLENNNHFIEEAITHPSIEHKTKLLLEYCNEQYISQQRRSVKQCYVELLRKVNGSSIGCLLAIDVDRRSNLSQQGCNVSAFLTTNLPIRFAGF